MFTYFFTMSYSLLAGKNGYYQYGICFNATFFA
ncbi:hypothetical protein EcE24377A_3163 [Escherichia coli O139:H28 str. E24377A]|uniref:Uncharacterized protein n=1 Tax=Escherichia coli O139:H28 (strain E24377A / ETEC) TaxID=331111 RepID=A7ZQU9_ECO24|nr:hypothetical protein EcE24377A_3163 [Escherichia coli O139:H28 str. E24377A]